MTKVDILAFGAHPDDVELAASATLAKHIKLGKSVVLVDLTQGELGTRGNAILRKEESFRAAEILGVTHRICLNLADGFFTQSDETLIKVLEQIRFFKPEVILANAIRDRHPDHERGAQLVKRAAFLSGLIKVQSKFNNCEQQAWRPKAVYHYIQDNFIEPDFVVDVSGFEEIKMQSILAYKSQFYDAASNEPETPISSPEFLESIRARLLQMGRIINSKSGEGFTVNRAPGINDITSFA